MSTFSTPSAARYISLPQQITNNEAQHHPLLYDTTIDLYNRNFPSMVFSLNCCESFRPSNLPPKRRNEFEAHLQQVRQLERRYKNLLQRRSVERALQSQRKAQRQFRLGTLNQLWLTRLLPELVQRSATGEAIGNEIDRVWRQGLPPGIRRVVWPLAIGNVLRITPELFEISSRKAEELRELQKLSGLGEKKYETNYRSKISLVKSSSPNVTFSSHLPDGRSIPTITSYSCPSSQTIAHERSCNGSVSQVPENHVDAWKALANASDQQYSNSSEGSELSIGQDGLIKASLLEILKNRSKSSNREDSLDCIGPDVPRTFPSLKVFQNHPTEGSLHLVCQKLLEGWVCYRPDIGYVQGMSFLAAMLLVYLDTFPAFVCLCNLLSSPSLLGLYRMEPETVRKRYRIFDRLLQQENPPLFDYFKELSFPREMYLLEWFLTLYAKPLSLEMASYVWDLFFLDGEVTLYITGVALLTIVTPELLPAQMVKRISDKDSWSISQSSVLLSDDIDPTQKDEETIMHIAFDRTRYVLSNIRTFVTDEGLLLDTMMSIKARLTLDILRDIQMLGNVEFSALNESPLPQIRTNITHPYTET